ncbi:HisA/HisF-related TIM barrel protein, partial [Candidatus Omnitrophota bacterium]
QTKGWMDSAGIKAIELAKRIEQEGFKRINYTDISRDGTLRGPDVPVLEELVKNTKLSVVASGGIATLTDIKNLREYEKDGLIGVILGKALYEGEIDLTKAVKVASK